MQMKAWDEYFLGMSRYVSIKSKDPSTQCGAVIVRPDQTIVSTGYNGFPRGIPDNSEFYADREYKLAHVIHAEMNALLFAREPVNGYTLYIWPFMCCDRCAMHVIQAGIKRVVTVRASQDVIERWGESIKRSMDAFTEAGVSVHLEYL
jgi:dCMP deaminase